MTRIYTKTGDAGDTGLFDGTRVSKADDRVDAYGEVDELHAWLGHVRALGPGEDVDADLMAIQRDLFAVGAMLADPRHRIAARVEKATIGDVRIAELEGLIDRYEEGVPPLKHFILAGGSPAGSSLHVARTVCRRAERRVVALGGGEDAQAAPSVVVIYLNRLSDLLFVMARAVNARAGSAETEW